MSAKDNIKPGIRLLYTSNVDISIGNGPGVNEREFIEALSNRDDIEATFVIPRPKNPEKCKGIKGVKYFKSPKGYLRYFLGQFTQLLTLIKQSRKKKYDGIIVRSSLLPLGLVLFLSYSRNPVFIKTQGSPSIKWLCSQPGLKGFASRLIRPANIWLHKKLFRRASVIDCCTCQKIKSIQRYIPNIERKKVIHIENATNIVRFYPHKKFQCRKRTGLESFEPVIGYVGGSPVERGGEQIVRAIAMLHSKWPGIAGCIVGGSDKEVKYLQSLARQHGVADRCVIPGKVEYDEVVYWINSFDIGVALDKSERLVNIGSSNQKIRQYLACGLPVITGKGTSSFIEEYKLGYLVDPDNLDDFVAAAKELLSLPQERLKEIAVRARRLCEDEFSIDAAVQKRLEYWKSEINEHPN